MSFFHKLKNQLGNIYALEIFFFIVLIYLLSSFISLSIDIHEWNVLLRIIDAMFILFLAIAISFLSSRTK